MEKGVLNTKKGFTIIEVALTLAIGGLIFLMVFVALPGLRSSQRDAERREAVTLLLENIKKFQTNNRGGLPGGGKPSGSVVSWNNGWTTRPPVNTSGWDGFYYEYLGDNFVDPSGDRYKIQAVECGDSLAADASCNDNAQYGTDVTFPNNNKILIVLQATCSGDKTIKTDNPRKVAALYRLERAGVYCGNI